MSSNVSYVPGQMFWSTPKVTQWRGVDLGLVLDVGDVLQQTIGLSAQGFRCP